MKTVGIIGGLGPETTAKFYLEIISSCSDLNKEARPSILVWNVPIPFKTEENLIIRGQCQEEYLPFLLDGAKRLERAGADFLVMPCNSMHIFIKEIRKAVGIPVLGIVEETVKVLKNEDIESVGLLATSVTLENGLFQTALAKDKIPFNVPSSNDQSEVSKVILNILSGKKSDHDKIKITKIIKSLGTNTLILACTDLQLLLPKMANMNIIDTMQVLAKATVKEILSD